ncbi:MAG: Clp protease ClpP [Ruminococcus flavefaciens]|nr:Clp protease ClpP [Ruminococcus flavefaciens]MCM1062347.1 Clp protease ClpP [Eubacterium sp.]
MNKKFWNWVKNEDSGETELYFEGPISDYTWFGDEITPAMFRDELAKVSGNLTVWINSPGGDCVSASQIYTMLRNHKSKVTVKIDGIAASAASVVAMAGDETLISPTGYLMVHNPMTLASGNKSDMEKAIALLDEIKEGIINAYVRKTGLSRNKISKLMDDETWLNAEKALQLGFVDGILFDEKKKSFIPEEDEPEESKGEEGADDKPEENISAMLYSSNRTRDSFLQKISAKTSGTPIDQLDKRLELLKY